MPISLPPFSRRRFLTASASAILGSAFSAEESTAESTWALFSDCHIAADRATISRKVQMASNLERAVSEAVAIKTKETISGVMVTGDCAYLTGQGADYQTFGEIIQPLTKAGLPVHLLMGNHDNREQFATVLAATQNLPSPVEHRIAALVQTPTANWFLLDSLDQTNHTPGLLGDEQRAWLEKALDAHPHKPAVIVVHHNVVTEPNKLALTDSAELLAVLRPRTQVKACIFGHTHAWDVKADESGIHLINLPPTAYVFKEAMPNGWVLATAQKSGLKLQLNAFDSAHPLNGEVKELTWRV